MLSAENRLRRSTEFSSVVRRGRRASQSLLTVHLLVDGGPAGPSRAGLVVSKAVGDSVVRHRTARRLRHLLRDRLAVLPAGSRLVVRAAPSAATASSDALAGDLDRAMAVATRRPGARPAGTAPASLKAPSQAPS